MAMLCDVCKGPIHIKEENGKKIVMACPLEPFKKIRNFYSPEFAGLFGRVFNRSLDVCGGDPEGLKKLSTMIPPTTDLNYFVNFNSENGLYLNTGIIQNNVSDFFKHFTRLLISIYYYKGIHYVDNFQEPKRNQFNYLWLNPTKLRECYFNNGSSPFKTMTDLCVPSLVIYPLGEVTSHENKAWPNTVMDLISNRRAEGKATWVLQTASLGDCIEVNEDLKLFLMELDAIKLEELEEEEEEKKDDKEVKGKKSKNKKVKSSSNGRKDFMDYDM